MKGEYVILYKTVNKSIENIIGNLIDDEHCTYCIWSYICPKGMKSDGGGNPIYPPCCDDEYINMFDVDLYYEEVVEMFEIEKIIYNDPATIVIFKDGEKVVVKAHDEDFDKEKGVAMAIIKRMYSRSEFVKIVENGFDMKEIK